MKRSVKSKRDYNPADKSMLIWMTCSTEGCSEEVFVDDNALGAICSNCVMKKTLNLLGEKEKDKLFGVAVQKKSTFPRGWKWMKEFVDQDGNVFHKGKEVPELKGTLSPTKVKPKKKKKRKKLHDVDIFEVGTDLLMRARLRSRSKESFLRHLGKKPLADEIKSYQKKFPKHPIILQDKTGVTVFLRR